MREIKFRGKRTDNGEWMYGYLIYNQWHNCYRIDPGIYAVAPQTVEADTVGEFTGLKDKNGVEIYEGDIIQKGGTVWIKNYHEKNNPKQQMQDVDVMEVCYRGTSFIGRNKGYKDGFPLSTLTIQNDCPLVVIGNIHEAPELIEKEAV